MKFTFPKSARLKTRADFDRVKAGLRLAGRYIVVNVLKGDRDINDLRLGIITTRKLGAAHQRTRARRLIRESFRLNQDHIALPCHLVIIARAAILKVKRQSVEDEFIKLCQKLEIWRG